MFGSSLLDVAIGMILIYLLLSLICTSANEFIESWLKNRATDLERGIRELLTPESHDNDQRHARDIVAELYQHPLVNGLYKGKFKVFVKYKNRSRPWRWLSRLYSRPQLPSYIPARNFALALMDVVLPASSATTAAERIPNAAQAAVAGDADAAVNVPSGAAGATPGAAPDGPAAANPLQPLRDAIGQLPEESLRDALLTLVDAAGNDVGKARENIEAWFNSSMERVSSWYKWRTQMIILILGFVIAIALNADSITLIERLSTDSTMRDALVAATEAYARANPSPATINPPTSTSGTPNGAISSDTHATIPLAECAADERSPECRIAKNLREIRKLSLPLGWVAAGDDETRTWPGDNWVGKGGWLNQLYWHLPGWLITALAISLGAPFWFDLLGKFMAVRTALRPNDKTPPAG